MANMERGLRSMQQRIASQELSQQQVQVGWCEGTGRLARVVGGRERMGVHGMQKRMGFQGSSQQVQVDWHACVCV